MTQPGGDVSKRAVNLDELLARVDNDRQLLSELVEIFREEFPRLLQSLQQFVAREDMKNVETASHALKGMLSGLSAMKAAETASRLEQMARAGEGSGLTDLLTLLQLQVADLLPELDTYTAEATP